MENIIEIDKCDFKIDATTVTNLLQIEPTYSGDKSSATKASMVRTKKRKYISQNGEISTEPFFSANGFRGLQRRRIASAIFSNLESKDNKRISVDTVHLYASGGGTTVNNFVSFLDESLTYDQKVEFRKNNPFISVFGAGLSDMDGKLSVCDLVPKEKGKNLLDAFLAVRFDETERSSILSPLLDSESMEKYSAELEIKRAGNKAIIKIQDAYDKKVKEWKNLLKNAGDLELIEAARQAKDDAKDELDKVLVDKNMSYQQTYMAEFIVPNTKMSSSIATRAGYKLTDIERGMVLYGLIMTSQQNIGSYSRIGWGAIDWEVKDGDDKLLFTTQCDKSYNLSKNVTISEHGNKILKPFTNWLEKLQRDDIFLP